MSAPKRDATTHTTDRREEVQAKLERVRAAMEQQGVEGLLLSRQLFVCWITGGLKSAVIRGTDPGFVRVFVSPTEALVVTQNIEGARIAVEDSPEALGMELVQLPWYGQTPDEFAVAQCPEAKLGNDGIGPGRSIEHALLGTRLPLLPIEQQRMRSLGADATETLEATLRGATRGTSEREIAAELCRRLELQGIFPSVLLVGADDRRRRFRHPTVNDAEVHGDVLGVLAVERDGLYVAVSRSASIGSADPVLARRHEIACAIEAELMLATRPGRSYQDVLDVGVQAYETHGYPGEWELHYQGGPIGYGPREALVAPAGVTPDGAGIPIDVGNACAWNPTVQGAKSEDTFLVGARAPEIVTTTGAWPTIACELDGTTIPRPAILELEG
jgi:Xaa-Pro dipeptidase